MKKIVVLFCIMIFSANTHAQVKMWGYDRYNAMIDSLLVIFGNDIEDDLALSGYTIPKQISYNISIVGYNIILEIFFTPKCSNILTLYNASDAMINQYMKQNKGLNVRKRAYFETFRRDIEETNKFPYDIVDYFIYKFITPYHDSPQDHAIYGEYKFKSNGSEKFEIEKKEIEILQSKDAILHRYHSTF